MAEIEVFSDKESLTRAAAEHIVKLASKAIAGRGRFTIALSGGSTPRPIYELLATPDYAGRIEWQHVHIFWGDERCVPPDDPGSNYRMTREALLDHVPIPPEHIHRIHGEDEPHEAASDYALKLQAVFDGDVESGGPPPEGFDLILLGMGDDGHTASLFPGQAAVHETQKWVVAEYIEKVEMWRVTLTPVVINAARQVTVLVSGADKAETLHRVLRGKYRPDELCAQVVSPWDGKLLWMADKDAAGRL